MVISEIHKLIVLGFEMDRENNGVDTHFEISCEDMDLPCGLGMTLIRRLAEAQRNSIGMFQCSILLCGSHNILEQITKIGRIFRTTFDVDLSLCPNVQGFEFFLDFISL